MSKKYLLKEKKKSIPAPVLKNMLASAKKTLSGASIAYGRSISYFNQCLTKGQFRDVEISFLLAYCNGETCPQPLEVNREKIAMMCKGMSMPVSKFCKHIDCATSTFQKRRDSHTKETYVISSGQLMALEKIGITREYISEYMEGKNAIEQAQTEEVELKTVVSIDNEICELEETVEQLTEMLEHMTNIAKRLKELKEDVYRGNLRIGGSKK